MRSTPFQASSPLSGGISSLLLTDDDVANLRHLAEESMGEAPLRALACDLAYLEAWSLAATGWPLPWLVPEALVLKLIAHLL